MTTVGHTTAADGASAVKFNLWREKTDAFEDISAYRFGVMNLTGVTSSEQVHFAQVSRDFFRLFGAPIFQGRSFTAEEDQANGAKVALLSDGFWRRQFGGDPQILGRTISLNDSPYDVIGIIGPSFDRYRFDPVPDVWLPFQLDPGSTDRTNYFVVAGRLKRSVTIAMANARIQLAADEYNRRFRGFGGAINFSVKPIGEVTIGNVRPSLEILIVAVNFVLLIASANVANLLLLRAAARKREIAIRAALGSGRGRIIRQLLTESILLSVAGGTLGLTIGMGFIRLLLSVTRGDVPRVGQEGSLVKADWRVFVFTIVVSLFTAMLVGLFPALQASRTELNYAIKEASGPSATGLRQNKVRSFLVISEIALAVVLLIGSALLIRTLVAVRAVNGGFDPHNMLIMRTSLAGPRFEKTAAVDQLIRDGVRRIGALPGVISAAATCCVPPQGTFALPFIIIGRPLDGPSHGVVNWLTVSAGYFTTFKIPLQRGRLLTDRDDARAPSVTIINEAMARRFWPSGNPLNDRIITGKGLGPEFEHDPVRQIVGVVGDVHDNGLNLDPLPTMYTPWGQTLDGVNALNMRLLPLAWVVRTSMEPHLLSAVIQRELRQATGGLPVADVRSMDEIIGLSTARQKFNMLLMSIFAGLALALAAVGVYGLIAYSVEQRTQEIGIRLALGAEVKAVRRMVILQAMRFVVIGILFGVAAALSLARFIASFLFGVKAWDPIIFVLVPVTLTMVALFASWLPALHASRINPVEALRYE